MSAAQAAADAAAGFSLLAGLPDAERIAVEGVLERIEVEEGTLLFQEGGDSDGLWLVASGRVELTRQGAGGRGVCGRGRALGALGLVADGPREATARTLTHCVLLRLSREAFEVLLAREPHAACRLVLAVAGECAEALRGALAELEERGR